MVIEKGGGRERGQSRDFVIWGRTDAHPPLGRRYYRARRKMESDLDMKTACECPRGVPK